MNKIIMVGLFMLLIVPLASATTLVIDANSKIKLTESDMKEIIKQYDYTKVIVYVFDRPDLEVVGIDNLKLKSTLTSCQAKRILSNDEQLRQAFPKLMSTFHCGHHNKVVVPVVIPVPKPEPEVPVPMVE